MRRKRWRLLSQSHLLTSETTCPLRAQVRTKTLVKSAVIQIDAAPFKQYYQQHYGVELGIKKTASDKAKAKDGDADAEDEADAVRIRFFDRWCGLLRPSRTMHTWLGAQVGQFWGVCFCDRWRGKARDSSRRGLHARLAWLIK